MPTILLPSDALTLTTRGVPHIEIFHARLDAEARLRAQFIEEGRRLERAEQQAKASDADY
jgi:hypothetical protein